MAMLEKAAYVPLLKEGSSHPQFKIIFCALIFAQTALSGFQSSRLSHTRFFLSFLLRRLPFQVFNLPLFFFIFIPNFCLDCPFRFSIQRDFFFFWCCFMLSDLMSSHLFPYDGISQLSFDEVLSSHLDGVLSSTFSNVIFIVSSNLDGLCFS